MHNNELEIMKYLNCWFVIVWMLSSSAFSVVDLSDVLNIKNWSKKDLLELISDSNYSINEEKLISDLRSDLERKIGEMEIDRGDVHHLAALFLTFDAAIVSTVFDNSYSLASPVGDETIKGNPRNVFDQFARNTNPWVFLSAIRPIYQGPISSLRERVVPYSIRKGTSRLWSLSFSFKDDVLAKLGLKVKNPAQRSPAAWKLLNLYTLASLKDDNFFNDIVVKSYMTALETLKNDATFQVTKEQLFQMIANATWNKQELEENPYILFLKDLLEPQLVIKSASLRRL